MMDEIQDRDQDKVFFLFFSLIFSWHLSNIQAIRIFGERKNLNEDNKKNEKELWLFSNEKKTVYVTKLSWSI